MQELVPDQVRNGSVRFKTRRVRPWHRYNVLMFGHGLTSELEPGNIIIVALGAGEKVQERWRLNLTIGAFDVAVQKKVGDGIGDRSVLEDTVVDGPLGHVGGYQDCWHAHAEAIEREWHAGGGVFRLRGEIAGSTAGRNNMIVQTSVFIVDDQKGGAGPQGIVVANRVVHHPDEAFTFMSVVRRMLIAG